MSDVLSDALAAAGFPCRVEAIERLAVLVPDGDWSRCLTSAERSRIVELARAHGFTHVSMEVGLADLPVRQP